MDGNDLIFGLGGNDIMYGGNGFDRMFGGDGRDTMDGGYGNDYLNGGNGDDEIEGSYGNDTAFGGAGNDALFGGAGADTFLFLKCDGAGRDAVVPAAHTRRLLAAFPPGIASDRDFPTAIISALVARQGAWAVRVHDVAATRVALAAADAVVGA